MSSPQPQPFTGVRYSRLNRDGSVASVEEFDGGPEGNRWIGALLACEGPACDQNRPDLLDMIRTAIAQIVEGGAARQTALANAPDIIAYCQRECARADAKRTAIAKTQQKGARNSALARQKEFQLYADAASAYLQMSDALRSAFLSDLRCSAELDAVYDRIRRTTDADRKKLDDASREARMTGDQLCQALQSIAVTDKKPQPRGATVIEWIERGLDVLEYDAHKRGERQEDVIAERTREGRQKRSEWSKSPWTRVRPARNSADETWLARLLGR